MQYKQAFTSIDTQEAVQSLVINSTMEEIEKEMIE